MKLLITLLLVTWLAQAGPHNYQQIINIWKEKVPKDSAFSLKQFAADGEMCSQSPCQLHYFISEDKQLASQKSTNRTVLLLAGLRGDDIAGSSILLNSYDRLKVARTIFLPLANPSGYAKGIAQTHPANINVENDFPVGDNAECNRSAAVKSLHYLFRTYAIDLAIYVHDGKPAISYSWAQKQSDSSRVEDFGIYADVADMVRFYANDKRQLDQVEAGPLYELKDMGKVGNFVDWAYGASKYPSILSKSCGGQQVDVYPESMMNGLVFSLGVGKVQDVENPSDTAEKQLNRGLSLIEKIVKITNPSVNIAVTTKDIFLSLEGCKVGSVTNIKILTQKLTPIFQKSAETIVKGDVTFGSASPTIISLPKDTVLPNSINYQVAFQCDNGWNNIGKTAFSQSRSFSQKGSITIKNEKQVSTSLYVDTKAQKPSPLPTPQLPKQQGWKLYQIIGITILGMLALGWLINGIRMTIKVQRTQRIKNFDEKFQIVEIVEDSESFSNNFGQKEAEAPQLVEIKQTHSHDTDQARLNSS